MRSFTHTETAFLAWVYGQICGLDGSEKFDLTGATLREEWEELTGETLDADFHQFTMQVHGSQ